MNEDSEFVGLLNRIFNLFAGLIYIITAILIFAQINLNIQNTLLFIAIIIIFISILRLSNGIFNRSIQKYLRISRIITGVSILMLAVFSIVRNSVESTSIILLAIALLINSMQKSLIGIFEKHYSKWFRITSLTVGFISVLLSLLIIFESAWSEFLLIILFAVVFLLGGVVRLSNAISNPSEKKRNVSL
jgi:uncharacterized membrane protein HdeD (DUF308 family)